MPKSGEKTQPIVIKRKKHGHAHHGGAWKIAYADFVTAMMAFFLLMWLLGSTTKGELLGIAEYFQTPLQMALSGGSGSGDSPSILKGGGQDLSRSTGQVKRGDLSDQKRRIATRSARAELDLPSRVAAPSGAPDSAAAERVERQALAALKGKIEAMVETMPNLAPFKKQLLLDLTEEGLRIQIVDDKSRPMFDLGSAELKPYAASILDEIGAALDEVPNKITVSGHTDATPYRNAQAGVSNWELSSERANAARRQMVFGGLAPDKVVRVVGHGSSDPLNGQSPLDPMNRRISIVVIKRGLERAAATGRSP